MSCLVHSTDLVGSYLPSGRAMISVFRPSGSDGCDPELDDVGTPRMRRVEEKWLDDGRTMFQVQSTTSGGIIGAWRYTRVKLVQRQRTVMKDLAIMTLDRLAATCFSTGTRGPRRPLKKNFGGQAEGVQAKRVHA